MIPKDTETHRTRTPRLFALTTVVALTLSGAGIAGYASILGGHLAKATPEAVTSIEPAWEGLPEDHVLVVRMTMPEDSRAETRPPRTHGWDLELASLDPSTRTLTANRSVQIPDGVRMVILARDSGDRERATAVAGWTPIEFAPGLDTHGRPDGFIHATLRLSPTPQGLVISSHWTHACAFVLDPAPGIWDPARFEVLVEPGSATSLRFTGHTEPGFEPRAPCREISTSFETVGVWRLARAT